MTSLEIRNATDVLAIPAPPLGFAVEVLSQTIKYNFGTVAFDGSFVSLDTTTDTATSAQFQSSIFFGSPISAFMRGEGKVASSNQIVENKGVNIAMTGTSTVGDGTIDVYMTYRLIEL